MRSFRKSSEDVTGPEDKHERPPDLQVVHPPAGEGVLTMTMNRAVWMLQMRFLGDELGVRFGVNGRSDRTFPVPAVGSLLIGFDQDLQPVELREVSRAEHYDESFYEDGWTYFAECEVSEMLAESVVTGFDFHGQVLQMLPAGTSLWLGEPIQLDDKPIAEVFSELGWSTELQNR